jgi:hypothetical protein
MPVPDLAPRGRMPFSKELRHRPSNIALQVRSAGPTVGESDLEPVPRDRTG